MSQYKIVLAVDFYRPAAECFKANFPDTDVRNARVEDITDWPQADVVLGGPPCFEGSTLIISSRGLIPIKAIIAGDTVLTHKGRWRKVVRVGHKEAPVYKLKGQGSCGIITTQDHHFLAKKMTHTWNNETRSSNRIFSDETWIAAKEMVGNYWAMPKNVEELNIPPVVLIGQEKNLPNMNNDFWWLVGCWVGDGWVRERKNKSSVIICSEKTSDRIIAEKVDGCGLHYSICEERTVKKIHISCSALSRWLKENFGHGAGNKTIPSWMYAMPDDARKAFLDGYKFADGYDKENGFAFTTISQKLSLGIKILLNSLGYVVSLTRCDPKRIAIIEGRKVNERGFWQIRATHKSNMSFIEDGKRWFLCRSFADLNKIETVYDIEVEEDHSFTADGIIVHNCQPFSTAGRMQGEKDDRNGMPAFISCVEKVRPRQFLIENVNGFFKSKYRHYVEEQLIELGYKVQCKTLDSADYGVPQHRRRCWVWGIKENLNITHKWPEPSQKWVGIQEALNKPLEPTFEYINKYPDNPYTKPADPNLPANPIFSKFHGKNSDLVWVDPSKNQVYKMTIEDALVIQSVPPNFKWAEKQTKSSKWVIVGNGWASRMGYHFAKAFKEVDPQSHTVIDLFCGGGLGAAGWHSWNGE